MPDIQYLGHSSFRLRGRDGTIVTDPYQRVGGLDIGRPSAHIVTVSHQHPDHNNVAAVRPARERVVTLDGPGEYEVGGVLINGIQSYHDKQQGAIHGPNTIYVIHLDDVVFCHLGDLGHSLTKTQIEELGVVDVLFVPVGGGETIGPTEAIELISVIEPRIVIPMHYATAQLSFDLELLPIERFAHEMGLKEWTTEAKLTITPSSLPGDEDQTRIVIMEPNP